MPATVHTLYPAKISKRQTLADLMEPDRNADERLLRVIASYEANGGKVVFPGEGSEAAGGRGPDVQASAPQPHVSEYLTRPLRTEDQVRAELNRPRIPQARGLVHEIFALALSPFRPGGVS